MLSNELNNVYSMGEHPLLAILYNSACTISVAVCCDLHTTTARYTDVIS